MPIHTVDVRVEKQEEHEACWASICVAVVAAIKPGSAGNRTMLGHLEGQTNIRIEALTNFLGGMDASTRHVHEALGEYGGKDITTFYLATLDKPHTGVYFFPRSCILMADFKQHGEANIPDFKNKTEHDTPRFATHFDDGAVKATKVGCCVLL